MLKSLDELRGNTCFLHPLRISEFFQIVIVHSICSISNPIITSLSLFFLKLFSTYYFSSSTVISLEYFSSSELPSTSTFDSTEKTLDASIDELQVISHLIILNSISVHNVLLATEFSATLRWVLSALISVGNLRSCWCQLNHRQGQSFKSLSLSWAYELRSAPKITEGSLFFENLD